MEDFTQRLAQQVAQFKQWQLANYSPADVAAQLADDAGYPGWPAIEALVGELLAAGQLAQLPAAAQRDLLFLIARNWDIGTLLAWLSPGPALSNAGPLTESDFLQLGGTVAELPGAEYDDAKCQVAACCRKLPWLSGEAQQVLLALFNCGHPYAQRQALFSLARLGYPGLRELLPLAWATATEQPEQQLAVLEVIVRHLFDPVLFGHYRALAGPLPGKCLRQLGRQLRHCLLNTMHKYLLTAWRPADLLHPDPALLPLAGHYLSAASGFDLLLHPNGTFVLGCHYDMGVRWRPQLAGRYYLDGLVLRLALSAAQRRVALYADFATLLPQPGPDGLVQWLAKPADAASPYRAGWLRRRPVPLLLRCQSVAFGVKSLAGSLTVGRLYATLGPAPKAGVLLVLNDRNRVRQYPAGVFGPPQ